MTSSIIENDIDDSNDKYQNASSKFFNKHVTFHDRNINLLLFFQQNQKKFNYFKSFRRFTLNSIEKTKKEEIFKFHFIDENNNRKYVIDDVENVRAQINQKNNN